MERSFKCPICPRFLNTAQGLKSHITRLHKNEGARPSFASVKEVPKRTCTDIGSSSSQTFVKTANTSTQPVTSSFGQESDVHLASLLANLRRNLKVLRRIPKGARISAADALSLTIDKCVQDNSVACWERLLLFSACCFQVPHNQETRSVSLATLVKRNVSEFLRGRVVGRSQAAQEEKDVRLCDKLISKRVEAKIAEGDIKGAVKIMSSEESFAPFNDDTKEALLKLHPVQDLADSHPLETLDPTLDGHFSVTGSEVRGAILSFPPGSAGGLDLMRPQHLKDLVSPAVGNAGLRLLTSLTKLCNLMFAGKVPPEICPVLYGASLCAFLKKKGGIRPIAIGTTLRRLVAKMGSFHIKSRLSKVFFPVQFGFGIQGGAEAVAHAGRRFVSFDHQEPKVFLKIDFRNAFNTVDRFHLLQAAKEQMPELYPFLWQCYRIPSHLAFGEELLSSQTGIQQGDPLGPGLFCSVVHPISGSLSSEFNAWYLDDSTLGGHPEVVLEDFKFLTTKAAELGLAVNFSKCELFIMTASEDVKSNIREAFQAVSPEILIPEKRECTLLGAPLLAEAIADCLEAKSEALSRISERLRLVKAHIGFNILKNSQAIPKLSYVLRCSPTWKCEGSLSKFDDILRTALESVTNSSLGESAWTQSALPIAMGGLGVRHARSLAVPAFLASSHGVSHLVKAILPTDVEVRGDPMYSEGEALWINAFGEDLPAEDKRSHQKEWEVPGMLQSKAIIYEQAASIQDKARLLSVASKESGAFLNALPSVQLGTLLEDDAFRIAVSLRLGSPVCQPHECICGMPVDESGVHGLSCVKSAGRRSRHAAVNNIIRRGLVSANIPASLEPSHLAPDNNSRPDGITQIPWAAGRSLVWDFTCSDGLAASHVSAAAVEPLYAASVAEVNKRRKYAHLTQSHIFSPIAVECLGSFGRDSLKIVRNIGRRITEATGEVRATEYLLQRISVAVQRGNASCITGTIPASASLEEFFNHM